MTRFLLFLVLVVAGCGVRGKPEPPLLPPVLGQGKFKPIEKSPKKNVKPKKIEGDWEEEADFPPLSK